MPALNFVVVLKEPDVLNLFHYNPILSSPENFRSLNRPKIRNFLENIPAFLKFI